MMESGRFQLDSVRPKEVRHRIVGALQEDGRILFAILHGSFEQNRPFRDVDIAVYMKGPFDEKDRVDQEARYALDLEKLLRLPSVPGGYSLRGSWRIIPHPLWLEQWDDGA